MGRVRDRALAGACIPPVGSMIRVRWTHLLRGTPRLPTALAMESVVDEFVFIVGPVLVTFLSTTGHTTSGVVTAFTLAVVGSLAFAAAGPHRTPRARARVPAGALGDAHSRAAGALRRRSGRRHHARHAGDHPGRLRRPGGCQVLRGVLIAALAIGSMVSGIGWGTVHFRAPVRRRLLVVLAVFVVTSLPLVVVDGLG